LEKNLLDRKEIERAFHSGFLERFSAGTFAPQKRSTVRACRWRAAAEFSERHRGACPYRKIYPAGAPRRIG